MAKKDRNEMKQSKGEDKAREKGQKERRGDKSPKSKLDHSPAPEDIRYIVRIANKDLNGKKPIYKALSELRGISLRYGKIVSRKFEEETGISSNTRLGDLSEEQDKKLEEIVLNPQKYGVPEWVYNRRKDPEEGTNKHLVMSDLDFSLRADRQRLGKIKSYRGIRLLAGLTVRGQRTKSTHRGLKRGVVGVEKKKR